jgi:hypothetical protein
MVRRTGIKDITYEEIFEPDEESMIKALKIVLECQPLQCQKEKRELQDNCAEESLCGQKVSSMGG